MSDERPWEIAFREWKRDMREEGVTSPGFREAFMEGWSARESELAALRAANAEMRDGTKTKSVARAICEAYGDDFDEQPKDLETLKLQRQNGIVRPHDPGLPTQADWLECAAAAIAALNR